MSAGVLTPKWAKQHLFSTAMSQHTDETTRAKQVANLHCQNKMSLLLFVTSVLFKQTILLPARFNVCVLTNKIASLQSF